MKFSERYFYRHLVLAMALFIGAWPATAQNHQHGQVTKEPAVACQAAELICAKTVTSAFAPNGDLWRLWAIDGGLYYQISQDLGQSFGVTHRVEIADESISARNENRPKIAFDHHQGVYLSWAMPRKQKHTADIRFSYSSDYGKSFSQPITVNNDKLITGHSFNEMQVSAEGNVSLVWLDSRESYQLRKQGKKAKGSNLYFAQANVRAGERFTRNQSLASDTCVCCRIAMDVNQQGELAIFWRHIFGDNIREFALLTITNNKGALHKPVQISDDYWQINGCPHQGGGISVDANNRYHLVWFNLGEKGKGIFYASTADQGQNITQPLSIGNIAQQAAHPHIKQSNGVVDIVWTQFDGSAHQLWHQQSLDNGETFLPAKQLASSKTGSDRPFIIGYQDKSFVSWQRPKSGHFLQAL